MNILPINNYANQKPSYNPMFKTKTALATNVVKAAPATLSWNTTRDLKTIIRAYKSIKEKLSSLTEEGISYIEKNYPNISIGESLIFHNCGNKKSSILVRVAESFEYAGLSRIIERKGNSTWSDRIVLNSFLLDNEDKFLINPEENKQKSFPKTREYIPKEEVEKNRLEEALQGVMLDLDEAILSFRKFLVTLGPEFNKIPDGQLPYNVTAMLRDIRKTQDEINSKLSSLPKKVELAVRKSFPNYKLITGLSTHAFGNLGKDKISLTYNPILAPDMEDYRRLNVFDENDNLIKTFVVSTSGKMISNLNKNSTIHLPRKLSFVDAKAIESEEYGPSFIKYLSIYYNKLKELSAHVNRTYLERLKYMNSMPLEVDVDVQSDLQDLLARIKTINETIAQLPLSRALQLRKTVPDLYLAAGSKGITFNNFKDGKKVYLLPMNAKRHDNLTKLSITDAEGNEKFYVFKDFKHIVKNVNPKYSQMIPKTLLFVSEAEGDFDSEIIEALNFLKEKMNTYQQMALKEVENFNMDKSLSLQEKEIKEREKRQQIEFRKLLKEEFYAEKRKLKAEQEKARQSGIDKKMEVRAESNRRKEFIIECKVKLAELKENVNSKTEDFKAILETLKSMTEDFIKTLN